jgi:hypothetical protein
LVASISAILIAPVLRIIFHASGSPAVVSYTLLPTRADALAFGVLLALAYRHERTWNWFTTHRIYIYLVFSSYWEELPCGLF